jgi:hypothetical protein
VLLYQKSDPFTLPLPVVQFVTIPVHPFGGVIVCDALAGNSKCAMQMRVSRWPLMVSTRAGG